MPHYPQQNFNAMRQDAIRRSREMQRRAAPSHNTPAHKAESPPYIPQQPDEKPIPHQNLQLPKELQNLLTGWDGERLALLGLLYFLYKEGADAKLLLAIAYIML
ncbi:MAG: hypothetical protein E7504_02565 [Ruminococcus sp.]|nr:hypothetical protein [Ruminococcus sp.]